MRNPAAGLTSAAPLAEAPVAGGTLLAAQAADAGQAAALSRLHVAAAPHSTDVAVAPLAAGASLEAVVPLLGRSRSVGAPLTEGRRVPAQAPSWHAGDPHSPGSGRSAGPSPRPCRSTGQSVGGTSRSRKANSCTLPGKRYTQLRAEPKRLVSYSQTSLILTGNPQGMFLTTTEPLLLLDLLQLTIYSHCPRPGQPFFFFKLLLLSSAGSGLCTPTLLGKHQHRCCSSCLEQDCSSLGAAW